MKRSWIAIVAVAGICLLAILLLTRHQEQEPSTEVVLNDVIRLQQMEVSSFDPLDAYHAAHILMAKQLYNTLVDIDLTGRPVSSLSERWESTDGGTWRFFLRKGVYFNVDSCFGGKSERLLRAADVKYTFERLLSKNSESLGISYFTDILGVEEYRGGETSTIEGISATGDSIVDFVLKKPNPSFPTLLTLPYASIVKRAAVAHYGETFNQHPVGTGPFTLRRYEPNKEITLVRNRDYWEQLDDQQLPYVDRVAVHLTADDNLAFLMFKNQKVDFLELSYPLLKQLNSTSIPFTYETQIKENPQLNFYLFNLATLTDKDIRRAINFAIDRSELQEVLSEAGTIATSLYPSAIFPGLASDNEVLRFDPERAEASLKHIRNLKLVCFEDVLSKSIADLIARSLNKHDVHVDIESVSFPVLVDRLNKGKYDLIQLYWGPLYADVGHYLNPFLTSSFPPTGNNFNRYSNPKFDDLVEQAKSLPPGQRRAKLMETQDVILDDMPFLLLYFRNTIRISNGKFDLPLHPLQYRFYKYAREN